MTNSQYKLVKNNLFKNYDEKLLIKNQQGLDSQKNKLFDMPLDSLFGFFEASYFTKTYENNNQKTLEIHLISDKPFSKDEISILQARLLAAYNKKFDLFEIYQQPENDIDSDKWINKRPTFSTNVTDKIDEHPIYRTIGKIKSFKTDKDIHNYEDVVPINKQNSNNNNINAGIKYFTSILKSAVQSKNYADFKIDKFETTKTELGYILIIYIKSKDERISRFFDDSIMTTQLFKDEITGLKSVEVINIDELKDKD